MATERVARTVFIVDVVWELRVAGQGARATTKVMIEMVIVGGTPVDLLDDEDRLNPSPR
jgi:hypothetical protein